MNARERAAAAAAALANQSSNSDVVAQVGGHLKGKLFQSAFSQLQSTFTEGDELTGVCTGNGFQKETEVKGFFTLHVEAEVDMPEGKTSKMMLKCGEVVWNFVDANGFPALKGKVLSGEIKGITNSENVYFDSASAIIE